MPRGLIELVRFPARLDEPVALVAGERAVQVAIGADRVVIGAALFPGEAPPGRGDAEGFPVVAPPRAVHAEILRDLGVHSDALAGYLGGGVVYVEIRNDGRESTTVVVGDGGTEARIDVSLTPDEPVVGVPYLLMESLRDRR